MSDIVANDLIINDPTQRVYVVQGAVDDDDDDDDRSTEDNDDDSSGIDRNKGYVDLTLHNIATRPSEETRASPEPVMLKPANVTTTWDGLKIPQWMKDYFAWHREQTELLSKTKGWKKQKYLVLSCLQSWRCGGLSDRIKPIPLFLRLAYENQRIFMIHWTRPCRLEEFLLPVGINWTFPENHLNIRKATGYRSQLKVLIEKLPSDDSTIVTAHLQDFHGGAKEYKALVENLSLNTTLQLRMRDVAIEQYGGGMYSDMFRSMFRPVSEIEKRIRERMTTNGLVPGQYSVAHIRSRYTIETTNSHRMQTEEEVTENAIHCAMGLLPGRPVYIAADSSTTLQAAVKYLPNVLVFQKSSTGNLTDPIHLDEGDSRQHQPSDFYDTFVDLFVMGNGQCLTYGEGGFGILALLISNDTTCSNQHFYKQIIPCKRNND